MRKKLCLPMLFAIAGSDGAAKDQSLDAVVSVNGSVLASIQPIDDSYVGPEGPYLDKGLGGVGPGVSIGGSVVGSRIVLTAEYSTAWLEVDQRGRLISSGAATGRLHDSMLTVLGGAHLGEGRARIQLLGGISRLISTPTSGKEVIDEGPGSGGNDLRRVLPTVGLDIIRSLGSGVSLVITSRGYFNVDRSDRARELGIGRQIVRIGVGLRVAVGSR